MFDLPVVSLSCAQGFKILRVFNLHTPSLPRSLSLFPSFFLSPVLCELGRHVGGQIQWPVFEREGTNGLPRKPAWIQISLRGEVLTLFWQGKQ